MAQIRGWQVSGAPNVWHVWTLPVPPSTNALTRNITARERRFKRWERGPAPKVPPRVKTEAYIAWIETAGKTIMAAGPRPRLVGEYFMDVSLPPGLDLDNIKALGDLLQSMGIVENDKLCVDLHVRRDDGESQCILMVREK